MEPSLARRKARPGVVESPSYPYPESAENKRVNVRPSPQFPQNFKIENLEFNNMNVYPIVGVLWSSW